MRLAVRPRTFNIATLFALATFLLIAVRAARTADPNWDTLAYHWPFAARAAGLCDIHCFLMPFSYEGRYAGFPKLWHAIQGLLWNATGSPAFADLLNIAMVAVVCLYLNRRFAVPLAWSWLAFIAIPEVQIQLTASYIDLPLNVAITLALMVVLRMIGAPLADQRFDVATALLALGLAAGSKLQLVPVCLLIWAVIAALACARPASVGFTRRSTTLLVLGLAGALVILPKLMLNAYEFGNPFYPIAITFGPIRLPGPEAMMQLASLSDWWVTSPSPVRWLASVLEFDAFRGRSLPWTLGQGGVLQSSPSFRMGGYFGTYVLGSLAILWWSTRTTPKRAWVVAFVLAMSVVCAWMPLSHELRYYMFWMITLVSTMLALGHSPMFARAEQAVQRRVAHALVAVAATSVILMTGGAYVRTEGPTMAELIGATESVVASVPDGGTLCILNRHRMAFLYSALFHPSRHYRTQALWSDEPAECTRRVDLGP